MLPVLATVGTAAFLQGHVQSSINAASLYAYQLGVPWMDPDKSDGLCFYQPWILGAMNASPFLFAAVIGAPLALPLNYWIGRRGAIAVAAVTILVSSLASAFVSTWQALFAVRVLNGIGTFPGRTRGCAGFLLQSLILCRNGYQSHQRPYPRL